jgi:hypothetical protein
MKIFFFFFQFLFHIMDSTNNSSSSSSSSDSKPTLCVAGCGFFGNSTFNNMCSQCYKAKNKDASIKTPSLESKDDTTVISAIEKTRKHLRSPSPDELRASSAPASNLASPAPTAGEAETTSKTVQMNKGRCFKCRLKVNGFI